MNAPVPSLIIEDRSRSRSAGGTKAPYRSPRLERSRSRPRAAIDPPTRAFAVTIADVVQLRKARAESQGLSSSPGGTGPADGVELIVDVPVWSNRCFSGECESWSCGRVRVRGRGERQAWGLLE